jgi:hypothetical protein
MAANSHTTLPKAIDFYVLATYNGVDGTAGYKRAKEYTLQLHRENGVLQVVHAPTQKVHFEYTTEDAFFKEWTNVKEKQLKSF